jgi:hypothetical protein
MSSESLTPGHVVIETLISPPLIYLPALQAVYGIYSTSLLEQIPQRISDGFLSQLRASRVLPLTPASQASLRRHLLKQLIISAI